MQSSWLTACAGSTATVASRQASSSGGGSFKDMQKWTVPSVRAEDIEICRQADGAPVELGRGGFCRVSARTPPHGCPQCLATLRRCNARQSTGGRSSAPDAAPLTYALTDPDLPS